MDSNTTALMIMVGGVNRFVETIKLELVRRGVAPEIRHIILFVMSLIGGVVAVTVSQPFVSVFTGTRFENVNPLMATLLTGLTVGLGSEMVYLVENLVRSFAGKNEAQGVQSQVDSGAITPKQAQDAAIVQATPIVTPAQVAQATSVERHG